MSSLTIGVLAMQGDFASHISLLKQMGVQTKEVRKIQELAACNGLIIPGGESTVILRQIDFIGMRAELLKFAAYRPVFGTCAGLILMSHEVIAYPMKTLGLLDISVERNAFGRQIESFTSKLELCLPKQKAKSLRGVFIRAPRIRRYGNEVKVLAEYEGEPVLVQQGRHLASSFHPELVKDPTLHQLFLNIVAS